MARNRYLKIRTVVTTVIDRDELDNAYGHIHSADEIRDMMKYGLVDAVTTVFPDDDIIVEREVE